MSNLTDPHWDAECRRLKARIRDLEHINASLSKIIDKKDFRDAPENDLPRIRELEAALRMYVDSTTVGSPYGPDGLNGVIADRVMWCGVFNRVLGSQSDAGCAKEPR